MSNVSGIKPSDEQMPVEIGLDDAARERLSIALGGILADSYVLLARTHGFHWNVIGPQFPGLHELFETQYKEIFVAIDEIAERIRALGFFAPGELNAFIERTSLNRNSQAHDAEAMLAVLIQDHEAVVRACRQIIGLCDETGDTVTEDLMNERIAAHEKAAWMLRASQSR